MMATVKLRKLEVCGKLEEEHLLQIDELGYKARTPFFL